jgi:hypothetical protein
MGWFYGRIIVCGIIPGRFYLYYQERSFTMGRLKPMFFLFKGGQPSLAG